MRILILCDHFSTAGGAGTIARLQAEELTKTHEVEVLTAHAPENLKLTTYNLQLTTDLGYNLKWRNYIGICHSKALNILNNYLAKSRPDICLIHNLHTYWSYVCLKVLKDNNIKSILTFHDVSVFTNYGKLCEIKYNKINNDYSFDYSYPLIKAIKQARYAFYNPLRQIFIKRYLKSATKIVTVSNALADALKQNKIRVDHVIHNGVAKLRVTSYPPASASPQANGGRGELTVTYNNSILFIGRIGISKGSLKAVEYLAYLKNKYNLTPELRLAGASGQGLDNMMSLAKKLGVASQIKPLGWLDKQAYEQELASCGLVIVPSICFDSLPTVILEAYQYKKPVVATIFGGAKEIVAHNKTGFIADPNDIQQFAEHMKTLLQDKQKAMALGQAGYDRIQNNFSLEEQTKKILKLIIS